MECVTDDHGYVILIKDLDTTYARPLFLDCVNPNEYRDAPSTTGTRYPLL